MPLQKLSCHACGVVIDVLERVGRGEECGKCGADLHCCLNCHFYDPRVADQCTEPQAERVMEKDRSNFCDYFQIREAGKSYKKDPKTAARAALDRLFKKE